MLDKVTIQAPAKINLFLKVLNKRFDGYHNIRSGITFINLFDEIEINTSHEMSIKYTGRFKPQGGFYKDCIIKKIINSVSLKSNNINLNVSIKKNIPVQGGLGSASTNAAGFIKGLIKLNLLDLYSIKNSKSFGADFNCFLFGKNCLVRNFGDQILPFQHPQYFFLLVKPKISLSTKEMYLSLARKSYKSLNLQKKDSILFDKNDSGNDIEKIAINQFKEIKEILFSLKSINNSLFASISGSGSCCYAAFDKKSFAIKAQKKFIKDFPDLWTFIGENNTINN